MGGGRPGGLGTSNGRPFSVDQIPEGVARVRRVFWVAPRGAARRTNRAPGSARSLAETITHMRGGDAAALPEKALVTTNGATRWNHPRNTASAVLATRTGTCGLPQGIRHVQLAKDHTFGESRCNTCPRFALKNGRTIRPPFVVEAVGETSTTLGRAWLLTGATALRPSVLQNPTCCVVFGESFFLGCHGAAQSASCNHEESAISASAV